MAPGSASLSHPTGGFVSLKPGVGTHHCFEPVMPSHELSGDSVKVVCSTHTHANQWPKKAMATRHLTIARTPCEIGILACQRLT